MLNRSASLVKSTSILEALPDKHDIKQHTPSILSIYDKCHFVMGRPILECVYLD